MDDKLGIGFLAACVYILSVLVENLISVSVVEELIKKTTVRQLELKEQDCHRVLKHSLTDADLSGTEMIPYDHLTDALKCQLEVDLMQENLDSEKY